MSNVSVKKLIEERTALLLEMSSLSELLHGSWVERYSVCSRKNCKCRQGEKHGPRYYLVINENGCQRQKYIPKAQVQSVKDGIAQYHRLREIADRITHINLSIRRNRRNGDD